MAASPVNAQVENAQPQDNWGPSDDQTMGPGSVKEPNGASAPLAENQNHTEQHNAENTDYPRGSSVDGSISGSKAEIAYREKQVKPNKVYVGSLPEHTRQEDLQSCFGKIGKITNIELKVGYGFVEFDSRKAAEESVAKYHEGYFMGNKIRVELSHGGGRTAKYSGDPGACFKCGQMGHWARECPNQPQSGGSHRRGGHEPPLIDRIQPSRDLPAPPRDFPPYRDDYGSGRYPPSSREPRYSYDYPSGPPPGREFRRPVTPPRDYREYRDYPSGPPPARSRDYDDYRTRGPPPPPASSRFEGRPGYFPMDVDPVRDPPTGYPPRYPPQAPPREPYDRYDRRPPPSDRYPPYSAGSRPRTPPGPPPRARDDFERGPPRDYPPEFRGRPLTPPRYTGEYPSRTSSMDATGQRYRRRSASPPPRSSGAPPYESTGYTASGSRDGFTSNGYSGSAPGGSQSRGTRDYPPRGREGEPPASYRRS